MATVELTDTAKQDILGAWDYVAQFSEGRADGLIRRMDEAFNKLARWPNLGESVEFVASGVRRFSTGQYVICYRPIQDGVRILRVLHGAREWQRLLQDWLSQSR